MNPEQLALIQKKAEAFDRIFAILFIETQEDEDTGEIGEVVNPDKQWDSAADFIEMVADIVTDVREPVAGAYKE